MQRIKNSVAAVSLIIVLTAVVRQTALAVQQMTMAEGFALMAKQVAALNAKVDKQFTPAQQRQVFYQEVAIDQRAHIVAAAKVPVIHGFPDIRQRGAVRASTIAAERRPILTKFHATMRELDVIEQRGYSGNWPKPPVGGSK